MTVSGVGRRRPKVGDVAKRNVRDCTVKYCVLNPAMKKIPVCKPSFMSIFGEYRANTFSVILGLFLLCSYCRYNTKGPSGSPICV